MPISRVHFWFERFMEFRTSEAGQMQSITDEFGL